MKAMMRGLFLLVLISSITALAYASPESLKNLAEIGTFTTHDPRAAEFFKDYLFIADGNSLLVYNTGNPAQPMQVLKFTEFDYPGRVLGLSISGEILYTAAGPGWIYVLDISDPEKPKKLYQLTYPNFANDVAVSGKYMYVADANTGMLIFDLSDPRTPELAGTFYVVKSNVTGFLQGWGGVSVAVSGNYAFLSVAQRQGFYVIDVSDPSSPQEIFHSTGKEIFDIAVSGKDVYLARADGTSLFELLDVSNPYSPRIADSFSILDSADRSAIAVHPSGYIYAAAGDTWHIFGMPDTVPPQVIIEKPKQGEIFADPKINVSGKASDKSGIKEVLVNGKFSGTEVWNQVIVLVEGTNSITITASDKYGNNITQGIQVIYRPVQPTVTAQTPAQTATPAIVKPAAGINILLYIAAVAVLMILIYWFYKMKK